MKRARRKKKVKNESMVVARWLWGLGDSIVTRDLGFNPRQFKLDLGTLD